MLERVVLGDLPHPVAGGVRLTYVEGFSVHMFGLVIPWLPWFFHLGKVRTRQYSLLCRLLSCKVEGISGK